MTENETQKPKIKIGDVFYTSWGYDQTNYDFVIVDKISPSGKTCVCRRASVDNKGASGQHNRLVPKHVGYGDSFRLRIEGNYLRGSYLYCDDGKRLGTLYPIEKGKEYLETDSMFGH